MLFVIIYSTDVGFTCSKADLTIMMDQCGVSQERALELLEAGGSVKVALASYIRNASKLI